MSNNSDPLFEQYGDMDFTAAKPVAEVPALAKLQATHGKVPHYHARRQHDTGDFQGSRRDDRAQ